MEKITLPKPYQARYVTMQYMKDGIPHGDEVVVDRGTGAFIVDGAVEKIKIDREKNITEKPGEVFTTQ